MDIQVETPIATTTGHIIDKQVALVPILRAGLGMVDALMSLIPAARSVMWAYTVTPKPMSLLSITASCQQISSSVRFWFWIPCLQQGEAP